MQNPITFRACDFLYKSGRAGSHRPVFGLAGGNRPYGLDDMESYKPMSKLSKEELVQRINEIKNMSACRSDFDAVMSQLERDTGCPEIGLWLFCPPDGREYTAEEIAERVLQ